MNRLVSLILAGIMILMLAACGGTGAAAPEMDSDGTAVATSSAQGGLTVGYARVSITPSYSVPLCGYGNSLDRFSEGMVSYLYTTCIAYSDGEDTVLVFQNDLTKSRGTVVESVRKAIEKKLGIPQSHVMVAATHNHSSPDLYCADASIGKYTKELEKWMLEAAEEALANMAPVNGIHYGNKTCENLNFIRHYTTEAGVIKGDNLNGHIDSPHTGHTHDADNLMQAVRIDREGADDVVLINWQTHPHRGGGSKNLNMTADLVGVMRDYVEANMDGVLFAYYTGASGNVNPSSSITEENITKDCKEQGEALGEHAVSILQGEMIRLEGTNVQITGQYYTGQVDHREDSKLSEAMTVADFWRETYDSKAASELARSYGFNSQYHADAVVSKSRLGKTLDVEMYAFSVGDLGFITAPYEMFDTEGVTIREGSPFGATFVITCCNDHLAYIPSMEGFNNNTYEANNGKFMPGTGEALAEEYVKMLEGLYQTK